MNEKIWDSIVVGAGLSGMMAGLTLAAAGRSVLLLDRRPAAGGRCGTFELDGHRFTIGCNDFGARIERDLAQVGIHLHFAPSTNLVDLDPATYHFPPGPGTVLRLLRHVPSVLGMVRRVKHGGARTLGELFDEPSRSRMGFRLLALLAYALGTPPQHLRADLVRADFSRELAYGHERMVVPVGGPQAITNAMVARLNVLGASLRLSTSVSAIRREPDHLRVYTSAGALRARTVLSAQPPPQRRGRPGLKVSQILLAVPRDFRFVGARTLIVAPPRPDRWIGELDEGRWPDTFGFHLFRDREAGHELTITGYLLTPRGTDRLDAATHERLLNYVVDRASRHLPGLAAALRYRRLLDPSEYEARHQLGANLAHVIPGADDKPPIAAEQPGHYPIGNAVGPAGEHANAAMLSGLWAARRALADLAGTTARRSCPEGHVNARDLVP